MGLIKTLFGIVKECRSVAEKCKKYKAMTDEELLAFSDDDLYEAVSLVAGLDVGGLSAKDIVKLNSFQRVFYVLNEFNNEIMNGGLCQFFVNDSREYAPFVSESLEIIGAYKTKALFDNFVLINQINLNDLEDFIIYDLKDFEKQNKRYHFDDFDKEFYELDEIYTLLVKYARENINKLMAR